MMVGYLVKKSSIDHSECFISFGISTNWDFERIFLSFNRVELFAFDESIDKRILGKSKISSPDKFKKIEFHSCNTNLKKIINFIENFNLKLVHIHANNYDDFQNYYSRNNKITFSKNPIKLGIYKNLPYKLDRPNKHNKKEIPLNFND